MHFDEVIDHVPFFVRDLNAVNSNEICMSYLFINAMSHRSGK